MKLFTRALTTLAALLLLCDQASAIVDVRIGAGVLRANPQQVQDFDRTFSASIPEIDAMIDFAADVIVSPPLFPFGIGLRYEQFMKDEESGSYSNKSKFTRTSVVLNRRFIDTLIYLGAIGTFGLSNSYKHEFNPGTGLRKYKAKGDLTASIGVEAGVKLLVFTAGAELGYMYANLNNLETEDGGSVVSSGNAIDVNLSGTYAKIMVGLNF
jgi:hypothetical protein